MMYQQIFLHGDESPLSSVIANAETMEEICDGCSKEGM